MGAPGASAAVGSARRRGRRGRCERKGKSGPGEDDAPKPAAVAEKLRGADSTGDGLREDCLGRTDQDGSQEGGEAWRVHHGSRLLKFEAFDTAWGPDSGNAGGGVDPAGAQGRAVRQVRGEE